MNQKEPTCSINTITIGDGRLSIEDVLNVALNSNSVSLSTRPEFQTRIQKSAVFLERLLADGEVVYGVNTGYGDSCTVRTPEDLVAEMPLHITRCHGCGLGEYLDEQATGASCN